MKRRFSWALVAGLASCVAVPEPGVDLLVRGGPILTMAGERPEYVEALAIEEGRIVAAGPEAELRSLAGARTRVLELAGRTLMPGFVDPHSHIAGYITGWGTPVLNPPPVGGVRAIADLQRLLREHIAARAIPAGELVFAAGYDDSLLSERRHPTRHDLDAVSTEHPVMVLHASGHLAVANTPLLERIGYSRDTADPAGGVIRREADGTPDGVLEELAALPLFAVLPALSLEERLERFDEVQRYYASLGVTTAQDGMSMLGDIALLREAAARGRLVIDVVAYPRWDQFNDVLSGERTLDIEYHPPLGTCCSLSAEVGHPEPVIRDASRTQVGIYQGRFKIAGIKITGDGSPQGKTAYLSQPYVVPPAGQPADYRGYPTVTQEELDRWFELAWSRDVQLLVHCNGDAAADMMIAAVRKAIARHGTKDLRPVMIHAQMLRPEQVDALAELGIVPSFFTAHTFYWGDWHVSETVGPERAAGMSPAARALQLGIPFTNHTDASVVPPNHFDACWTAVQRESRSGAVIGPDQRIPVYAALRAVTLHAARQYFEERDKGSLEPGKLADMIVVDRDPLAIDPRELRDVRVLETFKEGASIWKASL